MMKKIAAILCMIALLLCGCSAGEETTLTGIVVSVDGTQIQLMQFDSGMERPQMQEGEMPTMPEGGFGGDAPALPEGEKMPEGEMPTLPEGETMPEGEMPTLPEGETMPEGEMPAMPEGDFGGRGQSGDGTDTEMETTTIDLADAHITVEFDGGKATGSMEDITQGVFVTITLVDGKATNAVVSENSGFGGMGGSGGRAENGEAGGRGEGGKKGGTMKSAPEATEADA